MNNRCEQYQRAQKLKSAERWCAAYAAWTRRKVVSAAMSEHTGCVFASLMIKTLSEVSDNYFLSQETAIFLDSSLRLVTGDFCSQGFHTQAASENNTVRNHISAKFALDISLCAHLRLARHS